MVVHDLDWLDERRGRAVPARLYRPEAVARGDGVPAPLVVFSHGIGGSRRGYSYLGSYLARAGFASLHVQHVGSDRQLWTAGSVFGLLGRLQDAAQEREALARVDDVRFALDRVLAGEHAPHLDARQVVAAGHSYGANTSLLVAGARVERDGRELGLRDARVRAAILISAPPFFGERDPQRILQGVQVPTLHVTATEDVIRIPGYTSGVEDRLAVFEGVASPRKALVVFEGGSHSVFTDRGLTGGAVANQRIKAATQELSAAFLRSVFTATPGLLEHWRNRHAEVLAQAELRV